MNKKQEYIKSYNKENYIQVILRLSKSQDVEIINHLNGLQESKNSYIKRLVLEDMENSKAGI